MSRVLPGVLGIKAPYSAPIAGFSGASCRSSPSAVLATKGSSGEVRYGSGNIGIGSFRLPSKEPVDKLLAWSAHASKRISLTKLRAQDQQHHESTKASTDRYIHTLRQRRDGSSILTAPSAQHVAQSVLPLFHR